MIARQPHDYSATVDLRLRVNGRILDVGQVGHKFLILNENCEVAPGTAADVIITVDGRKSVHPVVLHEGIDPASDLVRFR
jgi:hypothetical protein